MRHFLLKISGNKADSRVKYKSRFSSHGQHSQGGILMQINHHTKNFNIALIILFLMAFVSCALIMNAHADIVRYYVTPNGSDNNDGSSWSSATTLAGVTSKISKIGNSDWNSDGYEIWIQSGDYTNGNAITISSSSRSGPTDVTIIGGFKGTETSSADRPAGGMSKETLINQVSKRH